MVISVLFLSANPSDTQKLELIEEYNDIDAKLRASANREEFDLIQRHAVSINGLQEILLRYDPNIVHFSGHGSAEGALIFQNANGKAEQVPSQALEDLFRILGRRMKCVFLNACYSESQAEAIAKHIDCVIGMSNAISDIAAKTFAVSYYQALGYGKSILDSFDLGLVQLKLFSIPEEHTPKLKCRRGVDPAKIVVSGNRDTDSGYYSGGVYHSAGLMGGLEKSASLSILYDKLQKSYTQLLTGQISQKEFWQVDGKGNLVNILMFLKSHSSNYGIGDLDKTAINNLLTRIPVLLSTLDNRFDNQGEQLKGQLKGELNDYYTQAVDLIGKICTPEINRRR